MECESLADAASKPAGYRKEIGANEADHGWRFRLADRNARRVIRRAFFNSRRCRRARRWAMPTLRNCPGGLIDPEYPVAFSCRSPVDRHAGWGEVYSDRDPAIFVMRYRDFFA